MSGPLDSWFAGLDSGPAAPDPAPTPDRRPAVASSLASVRGEGESHGPGSLDDGAEVSGELAAPIGPHGEPLPLRCRACARLVSGRCLAGGWGGGDPVPTSIHAGRCTAYALRAGVGVGRVWWWRVTLAGGTSAWLMGCPPLAEVDALAAVRSSWGEAVERVDAMPGFDRLPDGLVS
ncbi:hypothetical protein [Crenobacter cavernae]|uniref:Uncharacterized protein n=1 Tax=Crenobacter cavernae TaxID=2290923 RepID=A0A345Y9T2_9NEIS|nr:hypothetical protein [Crenobacter cavernae]AXK40684.1 hypothetical protein DWG20_15335 [Crenobacter cavernae]